MTKVCQMSSKTRNIARDNGQPDDDKLRANAFACLGNRPRSRTIQGRPVETAKPYPRHYTSLQITTSFYFSRQQTSIFFATTMWLLQVPKNPCYPIQPGSLYSFSILSGHCFISIPCGLYLLHQVNVVFCIYAMRFGRIVQITQCERSLRHDAVPT